MNANQEAKLKMYRATESYCDEHTGIITTNTAFETAFSNFKLKIAAIISTAQADDRQSRRAVRRNRPAAQRPDGQISPDIQNRASRFRPNLRSHAPHHQTPDNDHPAKRRNYRPNHERARQKRDRHRHAKPDRPAKHQRPDTIQHLVGRNRRIFLQTAPQRRLHPNRHRPRLHQL